MILLARKQPEGKELDGLDKENIKLLCETISAINKETDLKSLLQLIADNAKKMSGAKVVAINFYDKKRQVMKTGAISGIKNPTVQEAGKGARCKAGNIYFSKKQGELLGAA